MNSSKMFEFKWREQHNMKKYVRADNTSVDEQKQEISRCIRRARVLLYELLPDPNSEDTDEQDNKLKEAYYYLYLAERRI